MCTWNTFKSVSGAFFFNLTFFCDITGLKAKKFLKRMKKSLTPYQQPIKIEKISKIEIRISEGTETRVNNLNYRGISIGSVEKFELQG